MFCCLINEYAASSKSLKNWNTLCGYRNITFHLKPQIRHVMWHRVIRWPVKTVFTPRLPVLPKTFLTSLILSLYQLCRRPAGSIRSSWYSVCMWLTTTPRVIAYTTWHVVKMCKCVLFESDHMLWNNHMFQFSIIQWSVLTSWAVLDVHA